MEKFKEFEDILAVDKRSSAFCITNNATGSSRMISLRDRHEDMCSLALSDLVPEDIVSQFNIARNLAVFSWYSYSFHQIAELKALSTLEYALKKKLGHSKQGLRKLLKACIEFKLIYDVDFSHIEKPLNKDEQIFCYTLVSYLPDYRNELAHGSSMLHPNSGTILYICFRIIGKLYEKS